MGIRHGPGTWVRLLPLVAAGGAVACMGPRPTRDDTATATPGNVLIVLSDDVGTDKTAAYGAYPDQPRTPNIDALAAEGVLFRNAYASPTCSPTRASLLTGRYPTRHGIGRWIYPNDDAFGLPDDELTLPEMLQRSPVRWSTALMGKWHLTGFLADDPANHPLRAGFDHYAGSLANPLDAVQQGNTPRSYTNWEKDTDGELAWTTAYMTTDTFDDAEALIPRLKEPWLLIVAPNAAHTPLHAPPEDLLDEPLPETPTDLEMHTAMIEVLDDGIGRLMAAFTPELRARTTVVYTADNGTASEVDVIQPPFDPDRGKPTLFDGGVRVPLIISGPDVARPGSQCDALVSMVDLFPTVAELAQVDLDELTVESGASAGEPLAIDGLSLLPYLRDPEHTALRDIAFAEQFYPNGDAMVYDWHDRMVRDEDWKLIEYNWTDVNGAAWTERHFFHLDDDAIDEGEDLLTGDLDEEQTTAYGRLSATLEEMKRRLEYGHPAR